VVGDIGRERLLRLLRLLRCRDVRLLRCRDVRLLRLLRGHGNLRLLRPFRAKRLFGILGKA
jgi:hypothetical protein